MLVHTPCCLFAVRCTKTRKIKLLFIRLEDNLVGSAMQLFQSHLPVLLKFFIGNLGLVESKKNKIRYELQVTSSRFVPCSQ